MNTLGIDIGTTSLSFVIMDHESGRIKKHQTVKNDSFLASDRTYEKIQDPNQIWAAVQQMLSRWDLKAENIAAVGLTGQMHGILYVDETGEAVSPLYTWQDGSGAQISQNGKTYVQQLQELTGYAVATGFGAVTYYVHHRTGTVPGNAVCFCTIMDYIGMKLTGRNAPLTDVTNAAGFGLFDLENLAFDLAAIQKAGLTDAMFPEVTARRGILGYTAEGIPAAPAIGDNQASYLGAVKNEKHSILINVGTGSQISFMVPSYAELAGMELRPYVDGQYLQVYSSLCGGHAYALVADFYRQIVAGITEYAGKTFEPDPDMVYDWMNKLMDQHFLNIRQDENRMRIQPSFCGSRSDPAVRGSISGISTVNLVPEMLIFGIMEGIVTELYQVYDDCGLGSRKEKVLLVGSGNGVRKNCYLQKLFETAFGLPLRVSENEEEAACGAAIYCREAQEKDFRV